MTWLLVGSLVVFSMYLYLYLTFDESGKDQMTMELRMALKDRKWRLERDLHMTLFNLVNWITLVAAAFYLRKIREIKDIKAMKGREGEQAKPKRD